jgi:hypothetical protein
MCSIASVADAILPIDDVVARDTARPARQEEGLFVGNLCRRYRLPPRWRLPRMQTKAR